MRSIAVEDGNLTVNYSINSIRRYMELHIPREHYWTLMVAYTLITTFGILGNLTIILSVLYVSRLRCCVPNAFVANLAFADLAISTLLIPFSFLPNLKVDFAYGEGLCKFMNGVSGWSIFASSITIVVISGERVKLIRNQGNAGQSRRRAALLIVLTWTLSLAIASPLFIFYRKLRYLIRSREGLLPFNEICMLDMDSAMKYVYDSLILLAIYAVPVCALVVSKSQIQWTLSQRQAVLRTTRHNNALQRRNEHVFKMLFTVSIVYAVLRLPWVSLYILQELVPMQPYLKHDTLRYLDLYVQWLSNCHVCVNPLVFAYLNKNFQRAMRPTFLNIRRRMRFLSEGRLLRSSELIPLRTTTRLADNCLGSTHFSPVNQTPLTRE